MSRIICLITIITAFCKITLADPVDNAVNLLKTGNIREFAKSFAPDIEIAILGEESSATATQAEAALTNFFKTKPIKSVTVLHRVDSNPNIQFAVLTVVTGNGIYRTSVSLKLIGGQFLMNEIKIESDKR